MPGVGGDIELMPLADIALWLSSKKLTGTLSARRRGLEVRFTLRGGLCVQASSTDPREYLGQHLINFGHINEEQLQQAFDTQKETRVPLGRVLVMVDLLTPAQLQTVIHFKTREGLLEALGWRDGTWRFAPETDADPELDTERAIDLREVVSEAAAREAMWTEIRRVFPSDGTRCDVLIDPVGVDSAFDKKLLECMATGASVGEAALELRAMDFQVYARLYDLANRQLVRPVLTSTIRIASATAGLAPPASTPPSPAAAVTTPPAESATTTAPRTPTPAPALFPTPTAPSAPMTLTAPRAPTPAVIVAPPPPPPVVAPAPPTPALFPLPQPPTPATGGPAFSSGFALGRIALSTVAKPTPTGASLPITKTPPPLVPVPGWGASAVTVAPDAKDNAKDTGKAPATPASPAPSIAASVHELTLEVEVDADVGVEEDLPRWTAPKPPAPLSASRDDDDGHGTYMMVKRSPPQESPTRALEVALAGRNWSEAVLLAQRILEHDPHDSEAIAALRVADAQLRRLEKQGAGSEVDFDRVPHLTKPLADVAQGHLTSKERYVLSRIDGTRSLAQIAAVSPVQRAELARIVESFVQQGVLRYG